MFFYESALKHVKPKIDENEGHLKYLLRQNIVIVISMPHQLPPT